MLNKYLPIGSVVLLKNAKKRLMIIGLFQKVNDGKKIYDYTSCLYPVGMYDSNELISFNHEDIETVYAYGYMDDDYFELNKKILEKVGSRDS